MTQGTDVRLESGLGHFLEKWAQASARHRVAVGVLSLGLALASLAFTWTHLGIRSETEALFPEESPFRVRDSRFLSAFPMLHENIVLVVEGRSAESTREATLRLAARLEENPDLFPRVVLPADPFFEENGLLFLGLPELDSLADRLARLQPLLAGLARDESLRGLMRQTEEAIDGLRRDEMGDVDIEPILRRIEEAFRAPWLEEVDAVSQTTEGPAKGAQLDWSAVIDWGGASGDPRRRVILRSPGFAPALRW